MDKRYRFSIWYVLVAVWLVLIVQNLIVGSFQVQQLTYSEFLDALEDGRIKEVSITTNHISGTLEKAPEDQPEAAPVDAETGEIAPAEGPFRTIRVQDDQLTQRLQDAGVEFTGVIENTFFRDLLSWLIPIGLVMAFWVFMIRRMGAQQGVLSLGKKKAKIYMQDEIGVSFEDVAGVDEAKVELLEVVDFLKTPERFTRIGGKLPHGVLLVGPPGTGKTLLAKAVAGESSVPFFSMSGSEFVEMFVGVGASRVRDLFQQAKEKSPCIIFIDELDALGKARGAMAVGGHDEREQTLNQLLVEMDGFDPNTAIILMAATNRPEILDPALLRPGRFDRQILVDRPDKRGREEILKVHIKSVDLDADVNLEEIAAMTPGMVGADLANLVNEAALLAVRREKKKVSREEFFEAVERVIGGLEKKNRLINEKERRIVAYHETGHALVGLTVPGADRVQKITIVPRGVAALGYTMNVPTEERFLMTKTELLAKIAMAMGGRAAEDIVFGDVSTGAHNDLSKATNIARSMVKEYGMDEEIGHTYLENERRAQFMDLPGMAQPREFSDETAKAVDEAVKRILDEQYDRAKAVLNQRRVVLEEGAELLLSKEKIEGSELEAIMKKHGFEPLESNPVEAKNI